MSSDAITRPIHAGSAMHEYLKLVYRDDALPTGLRLARRLTWFYHAAPIAASVTCVRWYNDAFNATSGCDRQAAELGAVIRSVPTPSVHLNWFGFFLPHAWHPTCGSKREPAYAADFSWVEVIRISEKIFSPKKHREGLANGCWFYRADGSGIYLHTGRSLRANSREALRLALGVAADDGGYFGTSGFGIDYHPICALARSRGYDTLQIFDELHHRATWSGTATTKFMDVEVVSCQPGCFSGIRNESLYHNTCTRATLRTGYNASKPCHCKEKGPRVLNCLGTSPHLKPPTYSMSDAPKPSETNLLSRPRCCSGLLTLPLDEATKLNATSTGACELDPVPGPFSKAPASERRRLRCTRRACGIARGEAFWFAGLKGALSRSLDARIPCSGHGQIGGEQ